MPIPPSQRPGGTKIGERIAGWLEAFLEWLGLKDWMDREGQKNEEWAAIDSVASLAAWQEKYGALRPQALGLKAKSVGASENEISNLLRPYHSDLVDNPSLWLAGQLDTIFASPQWGEFQEIFGALAIDPWLASITQGQIPTDAPELEAVRNFLGNISAMEALGSLVSTAVETASAGQIDNAGKIFSDAKWTLGTCFTSWQSTSPIVEAVILKPLQRLINATFTPADFTRSQWMELLALGKIDPGRLGEELARQGYDQEKIGWLLNLAEKQPSRGDLLGMWKKDIISDMMFVEGLARDGYSSEWIDRFMKLYAKEETDDEKGAYLGTLRKGFKEQLVSEIEFRAALKDQGRSDTAIDLEIAVLKLDWQVEERSAAKSDIRSAYAEDVVGRPEAEKWLVGAGFSTHTVKLMLDTWDKQRAPTYRNINKAEILKAWGVGVLSRPEAYEQLRNVGYDEYGAQVLMETYARSSMATKPPETYKLKPQDVMWAWHTEVIEEGEVLDRLTGLGLLIEDAELVFETFQRLHPRITAVAPVGLRKDDVLDAWGRGVITEDVAFDRLVALGYNELDADILMRSYEQRPEALPPEPTIAELIGATRRGVIDVATLSQKLTVLGLKEEDVQFYVSYATSPLPETTRSLSRTDILSLWKLGRHGRAWAIERLLTLKYSPEDVEDILWLSSPEIEDTETYVLWRAGLIEDAIAEAMWSSMGFSGEQIAAVTGTE